MATILAATIAGNAGKILIACLMLLGAFFVLMLGIWYYRRWQRGLDQEAQAPWTFEDLRRLREQGKLTEAEYQALRASMIGFHTGEASAAPKPRPAPQASQDSEWDWVAEDDPRGPGFDVKK